MKNNKGITLIILVVTIMILLILAGVIGFSINNTYDESKVIKFTSYMKMIQKKVDLCIEEGANCEELGQPLNSSQKTTLQNIINEDTSNRIETTNVENSKIRFFSSDDIEQIFEISNIKDDIIVNFENREVISVNGVEKDGVIYHTDKGL